MMKNDEMKIGDPIRGFFDEIGKIIDLEPGPGPRIQYKDGRIKSGHHRDLYIWTNGAWTLLPEEETD